MTQPLAVLNDEEMHWLNDLGLPNQRRWLNHRNSVTNTAERFPPPPRIVAYLAALRHLPKKFKHKGAKAQKYEFNQNFFCALCAFVVKTLWLSEGQLAGTALFALEAGADF